MQITTTTVTFNHQLFEDSFIIGLKAPDVAKIARPGQFVMLRRSDEAWAQRLSRPFSLCRVEHDVLEIYFQVHGEGTRMLADCVQGDNIELYGPLGNGFDISPENDLNIIVAGGMGVAPFPFLALKISQICEKARNIAFVGAKNKDHLHNLDYLGEVGFEVRASTDDGSMGHHGVITELFDIELKSLLEKSQKRMVYACGPKLLLKKTAQIAAAQGAGCQIAMEERMACGTGACLVCVCKTRDDGDWKYSRVCKEGPVFNAAEVIFD